MKAQMRWANHLWSLPCHFIVDGVAAKKGCSLIHLLTRSQLRSNTHEPIWHRERKHFPFLTPITHEVLIPYDGCQSPAVYISSSLLHPLIFLSSLPCDYNYCFILFFFFLRSQRNQMVVAPVIEGCMRGWMVWDAEDAS